MLHWVSLLTFALTLVACGIGDGDDAEVSAACDEQMRAAANEPDAERADPLIRETAVACSTVAEWLEALHRYPAAMALRSAGFVSDVDVKALCGPSDMAETPVCQDAVATGIIPEDWWT